MSFHVRGAERPFADTTARIGAFFTAGPAL
jgi:hypothetical protein